MSEEIKEILEHLSATQKINNGWTSFSDKECKLLYDYITNLQEKENIIKEVREYIKTKYIAQGVLISYEVNDLLNELLEILDKVNREDK